MSFKESDDSPAELLTLTVKWMSVALSDIATQHSTRATHRAAIQKSQIKRTRALNCTTI